MTTDQPFLVNNTTPNGSPAPQPTGDFTSHKMTDNGWEELDTGDKLRKLIDDALALLDNDPNVVSVKVTDSDGFVRLLYNRSNG